MLLVIVESYGPIPNRDIHVAAPLMRIITQAFTHSLKTVDEPLAPRDVTVMFEEGVMLEDTKLVAAVTVQSNYGEDDVHDKEELGTNIADAIHQNGMFCCRKHHEPNNPNPPRRFRLELQLGKRDIPTLQSA